MRGDRTGTKREIEKWRELVGGGEGPHDPDRTASGHDLPPTEGRVGRAVLSEKVRGDRRWRKEVGQLGKV